MKGTMHKREKGEYALLCARIRKMAENPRSWSKETRTSWLATVGWRQMAAGAVTARAARLSSPIPEVRFNQNDGSPISSAAHTAN
jgi:hypothetical protein